MKSRKHDLYLAVSHGAAKAPPPEPPDMEISERVTRLEVIAENTQKAIDRLDRTMADLRNDMDRKFTWMIGTQIATLIAVIGILAKAAHIF